MSVVHFGEGDEKGKEKKLQSRGELSALKKQLRAEREALPIFTARDKLVEAFRQHSSLVIIGETGSGKTTRKCVSVVSSRAHTHACVLNACTYPCGWLMFW